MHETTTQRIVGGNAALLSQARALVGSMEPSRYASPEPPAFPSSIGAHLRHVLDHYDAVFGGAASGRIDYYERPRDRQTETDPDVAMLRIDGTIDRLASAGNGGEPEDRPLELRISAEDPEAVIPTSFGRELHFAMSHTLHHFALVATLCRYFGYPVPEDFGVAPSTLVHRRAGGDGN